MQATPPVQLWFGADLFNKIKHGVVQGTTSITRGINLARGISNISHTLIKTVFPPALKPAGTTDFDPNMYCFNNCNNQGCWRQCKCTKGKAKHVRKFDKKSMTNGCSYPKQLQFLNNKGPVQDCCNMHDACYAGYDLSKPLGNGNYRVTMSQFDCHNILLNCLHKNNHFDPTGFLVDKATAIKGRDFYKGPLQVRCE